MMVGMVLIVLGMQGVQEVDCFIGSNLILIMVVGIQSVCMLHVCVCIWCVPMYVCVCACLYVCACMC